MKNLIYRVGVVLFVLMFAGCATQQMAMTPANKSKLGATAVIININQEEIYAEIDRSHTGLAGAILFGAIGGAVLSLTDTAINNSRTKENEDKITPYRNALLDYDFISHLKTELRKPENAAWLKVTSFQITHQPKLENTVAEDPSASSILRINVKYYMSPDFGTVNITAQANLKLRKLTEEEIYNDTFLISRNAPDSLSVFYKNFSNPDSENKDVPHEWAQQPGALANALDDEIRELVAKLNAGVVSGALTQHLHPDYD